jgi:hypothetical protein
VRAHPAGKDVELVVARPVLEGQPSVASQLAVGREEGFATLRRSEVAGRPVGTAAFGADLEQRLGRPIARRAPGRKTEPRRDRTGGSAAVGIVSTHSE